MSTNLLSLGFDQASADIDRQGRADDEVESARSLRDTIAEGMQRVHAERDDREDFAASRPHREGLQRESGIGFTDAARIFTDVDQVGREHGPHAVKARLQDFYGRLPPRTPGIEPKKDYGSRYLNDDSNLKMYECEGGMRASVFKAMRDQRDAEAERDTHAAVRQAKPAHISHAEFAARLKGFDAQIATGDQAALNRIAQAYERPHAEHRLEQGFGAVERARPELAPYMNDAIPDELDRMTARGERTHDMWADFHRAAGRVMAAVQSGRLARPSQGQTRQPQRPQAGPSVRASVAAASGRPQMARDAGGRFTGVATPVRDHVRAAVARFSGRV